MHDTESGLYYLQSRYYDPKIGRFINADDAGMLGTNGDLASLNLFAYCGNNPIIRADGGGAWWHLAVGAMVGIATQYVSDVVFNLAAGASFSEALVPSSSPVDYLAAAGSGALAASGVGVVGSALANAAIDGLAYVVNCKVEEEEVDNYELLFTISASALTSGKGIDGAELRGVYRPCWMSEFFSRTRLCRRTLTSSSLRYRYRFLPNIKITPPLLLY